MANAKKEFNRRERKEQKRVKPQNTRNTQKTRKENGPGAECFNRELRGYTRMRAVQILPQRTEIELNRRIRRIRSEFFNRGLRGCTRMKAVQILPKKHTKTEFLTAENGIRGINEMRTRNF